MSRQVKRWIATCDVVDETGACEFNTRKKPTLHERSRSASEESRDHAQSAGHVGIREVTVERKYRLESEEIVNP